MTNCSLQNCQPQNRSNQADLTIKLVIIWIIIIVGLIGNSLVIAVVKMIRAMRSTTNYLLLNVAVADITTLSFTIIHFIAAISKQRSLPPPGLHSFLCKFIYTNTIVIVTLLVTVLTLTLLAVERYRALMKPLTSSHRLTTDKIGYVIAGIWVTSFVLVSPLFATLDIDPITFCGFTGEIAIYMYCLMSILTVIPFMVISFCYSQIIYGMYFKKTICNNKSERRATQEEIKEKQRLVRLLILLTVVFFVAFIPFGILIILEYSKIHSPSIETLKLGAQYLTLLNCSLNPFIYAFQSTSYRRSFVYIFKKMTCRDTTVDVIELREMHLQTSVRSV